MAKRCKTLTCASSSSLISPSVTLNSIEDAGNLVLQSGLSDQEQQVGNNGNGIASCYVRSCDQLISGRFLTYERALEIIQNEEYLTEADLSVIRRLKKRKKRNEEDKFRNPLVYIAEVIMSGRQSSNSTCTTFASRISDLDDLSYRQSVICPDENDSPPSTLLDLFSFNSSVASPAVMGAVVIGGILAAGIGITALGGVGAGAGVGGSGGIPQPGSAQGGGLPVASSPLAIEALALVPLGLEAVAVFPPYAGPRSVDAVSVIFRENSANNRFKRRFNIWDFNSKRRFRRSMLARLRHKTANVYRAISKG